MTLTERLQAASEGSRELDGQIYCAISGLQFHMWDGAGIVVLKPDFKHIESERVRHFSTNLQDAVSLVPEGWTWQVSNRAPKPHKGRAYIHNGELQFVGGGQARNAAYQGFEDTAVTPALALCIAIIKAHESKAEAA